MFFLRDVFIFPADLEKRFLAARWGGLPGTATAAREGKAIRALWEELAGHRGFARDGEHYSFRKELAEAYASYYLPVNALKPALVLEEAFLLESDILPEDSLWLDFGSGPGTAYWGVSWWAERRGRKFRHVGWERSSHFVAAAARLAPETRFLAADRKNPKDWLAKARGLAPTHLSFVNSVAEIFPDPSARQNAIEELFAAMRAWKKRDGKERYLLIIEPGSRESSRELAALKDALPAPVLLPCLDKRPCGALASPQDWCHEEAACEFPEWLNEIGSHAGLRKESILFSYALLSTRESPSRYSGFARMVSQRLERKGQVECRLCTPRGKVRARVQHSKTAPENEFFFDSRRGDVLPALELGEKGDVISGDRVDPPETVF